VEARVFYAVVIVSFIVGVTMDFNSVNAANALLWSAVVNGLLAPLLLLGIVLVASDRRS
jgi:Mn2+/Fe2+ NRAMP family transporter